MTVQSHKLVNSLTRLWNTSHINWSGCLVLLKYMPLEYPQI